MSKLNIYLLSNLEGAGYDQYDGFVVIAPNEESARKLVKREGSLGLPKAFWQNQDKSSCERIGTAEKGQKQGIILSDFNRG